MDEGVREADLGVDLHQDIGDARLREALVEIEDELVGAFRGLGGEPVDVQAAVTNDATRDSSGLELPWRVSSARVSSMPVGRRAIRRHRAVWPVRHLWW